MNKRALVSLLAAPALAFGLAACGSNDGTATDNPAAANLGLISDGTLTVCSDVPYPPFEDFDNSAPTGFKGVDVDIVQHIADGLGLKLKYKDSSFDALESGLAVNSRQCDMIASAMTITDDRKQHLAFSDGYFDSSQSLLVPADSDIASINDLAGKKVGVQVATTGKHYAEENATGASIVTLPSDAEMFQSIKAGQVDALLQDYPVNYVHTADGAFKIVETYPTNEQYGFAFKLGNDALVTAINEQLAKMQSDGSYDEIYNTWIQTS